MCSKNLLSLRGLVADHVHTTLYDEQVQWQPPLDGALRGLSAAQAAWKPAPPRHSIWQIVRHLTLWKRGVLQAWDGDPPDGHQLAAADWKDAAGNDAEWDRDRKALLDISAEFLARVKTLDEANFSRRIVWYKGGWSQPLAMRIVRTATHDIYHAGQIMYLRALQGIPPR
jgi:uncharacterized damage-inducible protein DinB